MKNKHQFYLSNHIELSTDESTSAKFKGVAYSGDSVNKELIIDIESTIVAENMPLLFNHNHEQTIGIINEVDKTETAINITGEIFSDIDKKAQELVEKAKRGARYQMSVGIYDFDVEESEGKLEINGRNFDGSFLILKNGLVREVSIVALGADNNTNAEFFSLYQKTEDFMGDKVELTQPENRSTELSVALEKNMALEARAIAAEQEVAELKKERRIRILMRTFKALGREMSDTNFDHYIELSNATFNKIIEDLRGLKKVPSTALFSEVANTGKTTVPVAVINPMQIYQQRKIK